MRSYACLIEKYGTYSIKINKDGICYTIVMTKNLKQDRKEPYIFFISNIENAWKVLEHYMERWKIECCFLHLKSNGFDLEAMNLKQDLKIELMMGLVAVAYAVAVREGMLAFIKKPFRKKKYNNGKEYYEVSIFRKGLELLESSITNFMSLLEYLIKTMRYAAQKPCVNYILIGNVQ